MTRKLGFIGGGQMAEAIIKGLLHSQLYSAEQIQVLEPLENRKKVLEQTYNILTVSNMEELHENCSVIILAVKPQMMPEVLAELRPYLHLQLLITIAAGLPLSFYSETLDKSDIPIIRVMPNMPALIQEAASALCRNNNVSDEDFTFAKALFATIGSTVAVKETAMDAVTGLSGSGPAYVFSFVEALIDGGVKCGLSRAVSRELSIQTLLGAARMLQESDNHPAVLKDQVTSPGGTTASALHVMEDSGFTGIVISMVEAACRRSIELGK